VKNRFQSLPFKRNLERYTAVAVVGKGLTFDSGGALQVESS
jgi:leucyl aminopeptidase